MSFAFLMAVVMHLTLQTCYSVLADQVLAVQRKMYQPGQEAL